jgi:hypothetical protein
LERALRLPKLRKSPKLDREPLVVVVLGPTASGKTALALGIARRFCGEIVNCDSVAMYREFEIGTAKPSAAERAEVPHHLFDCVDPLSDVTAGEYARQARQALREIVLRETDLSENELSLKDFFLARSDPKSCATNCAAARRSAGPSICIASCGGSTLRRRNAFTPMTYPR